MSKRNILIGSLFIAYGLFELYNGRPLETILYTLVGSSFIVTWASYRENISAANKKLLTRASWLLIIFAVLMFLYLLRIEAWGSK